MNSKNSSKKLIGILIAVIVFILVLTLVPISKEGLKPQGKAALAVFLTAFVLWVT